jgi:hypothetical protein
MLDRHRCSLPEADDIFYIQVPEEPVKESEVLQQVPGSHFSGVVEVVDVCEVDLKLVELCGTREKIYPRLGSAV